MLIYFKFIVSKTCIKDYCTDQEEEIKLAKDNSVKYDPDADYLKHYNTKNKSKSKSKQSNTNDINFKQGGYGKGKSNKNNGKINGKPIRRFDGSIEKLQNPENNQEQYSSFQILKSLKL